MNRQREKGAFMTEPMTILLAISVVIALLCIVGLNARHQMKPATVQFIVRQAPTVKTDRLLYAQCLKTILHDGKVIRRSDVASCAEDASNGFWPGSTRASIMTSQMAAVSVVTKGLK